MSLCTVTLCDLTSIFGHYHFNQAATAWEESEDDGSVAGMEATENVTSRGRDFPQAAAIEENIHKVVTAHFQRCELGLWLSEGAFLAWEDPDS